MDTARDKRRRSGEEGKRKRPKHAGSASSPASSPPSSPPVSPLPSPHSEFDPYLLQDAAYLSSTPSRWRNRQRTLILSSRGVSHRQRHLVEDLRALMPHHKKEVKFDKRQDRRDIIELCALKHCNNVLFFEARRQSQLFMWMSRAPDGPGVKLEVLNIHTSGELMLSGNSLKSSRPLLVFSEEFDNNPVLNVVKYLFIQAWGTPKNHPKAQPFFDRVFSFFYHDDRIWFRNYQITPETEVDLNKPDKIQLTEIGPRMVFHLIKVFKDSFGGKTLYKNPNYVSPAALRRSLSVKLGSKYAQRKEAKGARQGHLARNVMEKEVSWHELVGEHEDEETDGDL